MEAALNQLAQALESNKRQRMEATPIAAIHSSYAPPKNINITNCYYLLTEVPQYKSTTSTILLSKGYSAGFNSAEANQISLISLSKKMFEGTKPMEGAELKALYKAMKKQRYSNIESLL